MDDPFLDTEEGAVHIKEVTKEIVMASQADKSKSVRASKKRAFTLKINKFK